MRVHKSTLIATATAALVVAALAAAPAAEANQPQANRASSASAAHQLKADQVPSTGGRVTNQNVIVILKNQHSALKTGRVSARSRAIAADQAGVVSAARKLGATHIKQYSVVNAVSATIKSDQVAQLSRSADVAAVVPDLMIKGSSVTTDTGKAAHGAPPAAVNSVPYSSYCSTDQAHPTLEPEALQTMHVAYTDPNTPSASQLATGAGVKVAWIADGIDINNPDFIRANGQHVFSDYQDFSGDGLNAPTSGAEAFGDASSVGAQGRETYNLADYASAANPLPNGCYIRVQGVAPGASLVGLKVFGNSDSAPTSHFINAIQYAVNTADVDVLNESFGGDPYPDNMNDPISLANNAAIAAGVTVVASSGDSGTTGTIGSPATSSQVIGVAATTNFRSAAQIKLDGFSNPALGIKSWADDNISSLSSGGYAQNGKVPDVAAPGDSAWALCTPDPDQYEACLNEDGTDGASVLDFGGTSQSSPLTAGTAALVIQAYKRAHHGVRPSPAMVKAIIVGTAQDLGHPAFEQGAGEVDALAAVRAALSIAAPGTTTRPSTAVGSQLVATTSQVGVDQLDLAGQARHTVSGRYTLRNASKSAQTVKLSTRALTKVLSTRTGNIKLDPSQTFPNVTGGARAYKIINFNVPAGADRLDASIAMPSAPNFSVFLALVDPFGVFQAYNSPQGTGNFGHVDARYPAPGHWKAMVWANPAFTGNINYEFKTSRYATLGTVHPSSVTLAPGGSTSVTASFPTGSNAGDSSAAVVMKTTSGTQAALPVSIRTYLPTSKATNTFTGVITGGNGRAADAASYSYYLNVPAGKPGLSVTVNLNRPQYPNEVLLGFLVGPNGSAVSAKSNIIVNRKGVLDVGRHVVTFARVPRAGRWRFVLQLADPAGGQVVNQPFTGSVRFAAATVHAATTLPTKHTKLTRGKTYKYRVVVKNNSTQQEILFADPRRDKVVTYTLASQSPDNNQQNLTLPNSAVTPNWLVPTGTSSVDFYANASVPVGLDTEWEYGDPETFSPPAGNSAHVTVAANPAVANGSWTGDVGEPGPFDGPAPTGHVAVNATATTNAFDFAADSSLGDYWFTSLVPASSNAAVSRGRVGVAALGQRGRYLEAARVQADRSPVSAVASKAVRACNPKNPVLDRGASCTFTFTITPSAARHTTVRGQLHVQALDPFGGTTNDLVSLPYAYTVK